MSAWPVNTFAGNPLDRAGERRCQPDWLQARLADPATRAVLFWKGQPLLTDDGAALARVPADLLDDVGDPDGAVFLGLEEGRALFAAQAAEAEPPSVSTFGRFEGLREAVLADLAAPEAGIAATAKALFEWHGRHRFCSVCGKPSEPAEGGWKRVCPSCRAQHFPRTDPVVIMLPVRGDEALLGRQAAWPAGRFSALAGFVEPGESLEEACRREVQEEAGLFVTGVRHHSSQPWPFPTNLMLGIIAEVADGEARPDQTELEAVRWITREEGRALIAGTHPDMLAPPPIAIAHQLIKSWSEEA